MPRSAARSMNETARRAAAPRAGGPQKGAPMRCLAATAALTLAASLGSTAPSGLAPETTLATSSMAGSEVYRTYCAVCHGEKGKGDGPLAGGLRSAPPDLTLMAAQNGGEFPAETVARIIDGREPVAGHGGPDMPVWGDAFKGSGADEKEAEEKIQSVVEFVGRLQAK
jgi:mono/diheme cytochrome c family protein